LKKYFFQGRFLRFAFLKIGGTKSSEKVRKKALLLAPDFTIVAVGGGWVVVVEEKLEPALVSLRKN